MDDEEPEGEADDAHKASVETSQISLLAGSGIRVAYTTHIRVQLGDDTLTALIDFDCRWQYMTGCA
ncbi:hypothetical protein E2562_038584 [Oryza meyeriana var. granulata]|uniref:Uncharacterized protein n=1 Tax=Oryza meyeriana var. granulata TaxID=110450 RepID=A0A6G1DTI9_9ORYZ|nr:hypothetical protein E2562_038584 [Oryza meyeriana var. granulata]